MRSLLTITPVFTRTKRLLHSFSLLLLSFISLAGAAQITPSNCVQGCTSNDVQIKNAYLSDASGNRLSSTFVCPVSGTANVYLTLELTTSTPRVGVSIFTRIKLYNPVTKTIGAEVTGSPIAQCFGIALNQPTNKVTFSQTFAWTCGTPIVMTDVFIAWGTGNSNFCTGTGFQCPATPSKCYQLPGGSFIAIQTPVPQNQTVTQCSDAKGGTTSTFNLNNVSVTSSTNVTVTWWENFTSPSTFSNQITSPGSYSSATKTVYAKITSNSDATIFSVATVNLVVNQTPNLVITNPAAVCSPATVDITASSITAGSTIPSNATLTYYLDNSGSPGTQITTTAAQSLGAGTYWIKAVTSTTPSCSDQKQVTVTVTQTPAAPVLSKVDNCNGTTTITAKDSSNNVISSGQLTWSNGATGNPITVNTTTSVTVTRTVNSCTSTSSSSITPAPGSSPIAPAVTYNAPACDQTTFSITITNVTTGVTYTVQDKNGANITGISPGNSVTAPNTGNITFSNIPAGSGYQVTASIGSCTSATTSCGTPSAITQKQSPGNLVMANEQPVVTAYPNPFSDRVKFVIRSTASGDGSLDVYNIMGQKVKTVYQGHINMGSNSFELTIPKKEQATLIYIFRVGDKKVTGKLLQLNN